VELFNPLPLKSYRSGTGSQKPGNGFEKGGLPRSVTPQKGDDLSPSDRKRYSPQYGIGGSDSEKSPDEGLYILADETLQG